MDTDTVLLLVLTLIGHSAVAYTTVWYIFRKKSDELRRFGAPENLVKVIKAMLQVRETEDKPSFLEEILGALGQYIGRYIAGMMGRTTRSANALGLEMLGENSPIMAAILKVPGARKFMSNPLVQQYVMPAIEQAAAKALGAQQQQQQTEPQQ